MLTLTRTLTLTDKNAGLVKRGYCRVTNHCADASVGHLNCAIANVAGGIDGCMAKYCSPVPDCAFVSVNNKDGTEVADVTAKVFLMVRGRTRWAGDGAQPFSLKASTTSTLSAHGSRTSRVRLVWQCACDNIPLSVPSCTTHVSLLPLTRSILTWPIHTPEPLYTYPRAAVHVYSIGSDVAVGPHICV